MKINNMKKTMKYCSYGDYSVIYDVDSHIFSISYKKKHIIHNAYIESVLLENDEKQLEFNKYKILKTEHSGWCTENNTFLSVSYGYDKCEEPSFVLKFVVGYDGVSIAVEKGNLKITGNVDCHAENVYDLISCCLNRDAKDLRSAIGKAVSPIDNAVYNKKLDCAVVVGESEKTKLCFKKETQNYSFHFLATPNKCTNISVKENVLALKYGIKFSPINKKSTFSLPPVGWMTWYAVKFDACEEKVLKNAKWQAENLKDFGANTVWVDWEWYHDTLTGERSDGVNSLNPDPIRYPHGLKYVSDRIREMGLIPSLWIGYTNEPCKNDYIEKYPDMVLVTEANWCGQYFYDFTNPHYINEYLPEALNNVHKWGYDAVKYDTIPISIIKHEEFHMNMHNPDLSTKEAFRNMIKKTREILGKDMYMLSCSGLSNSAVLWACDMFDAARVGDDIFSWEDYFKNGIERIQKFYPLHNIQFYNDMDNVVLREEFNTYEQAKSRITMVSLLGLPMTFGDEFETLSEETINLIKRNLPILDIHPMDLCSPKLNKDNYIINLSIAKDYENYQVSSIFNMMDKKDFRTLSLKDDFHLYDGDYLVYDFYRNVFLGKFSDSIELDFEPYECRVLSLRPYIGVPQVISTSRHITQGAAEISNMSFNNNELKLVASLVEGDVYTVSLYVPDEFLISEYIGFESCTSIGNVVQLSICPTKTKIYEFGIDFIKNNKND